MSSHYSSIGHSVSERGKTFRLGNRSVPFCKIKTDGGLYPSGQAQKKCDWVFILCETNRFYFVELKGSGKTLKDDQIVQTIQDFKNKISSLSKDQIYGVIVGSNMPSQNTATLRKMQDNFRKHHGNKLLTHSSLYELSTQ